eukprot:4200807-Prymnesium_polylepis.2
MRVAEHARDALPHVDALFRPWLEDGPFAQDAHGQDNDGDECSTHRHRDGGDERAHNGRATGLSREQEVHEYGAHHPAHQGAEVPGTECTIAVARRVTLCELRPQCHVRHLDRGAHAEEGNDGDGLPADQPVVREHLHRWRERCHQ